jgi:polar amino acid transport system permease protein
VVIGLVIAFIRMMKIPVVDQALVVYISLARATPLVTLVLFLFLSLPTLGINLDKTAAAIVALTLNTSAFNAEIWRNAFRNFPREQRRPPNLSVCGAGPIFATLCCRKCGLKACLRW